MAVYEIDMPPMAFLDIPSGPGDVLRITPRVVAVVGHSREAVAAAGYSLIHGIMQRLDDERGIIWWRTRPKVEENPMPIMGTEQEREDHPPFRFWARLATSPELPESYWDGVSKKEGERIELTPEILYERERAAADPLHGNDLDYSDLHADYGTIRYIGGRGGSQFGKDPHTADMTKILSPDPVVPNMAGEQPDISKAAPDASPPKVTPGKKTRHRASKRARRPNAPA